MIKSFAVAMLLFLVAPVSGAIRIGCGLMGAEKQYKGIGVSREDSIGDSQNSIGDSREGRDSVGFESLGAKLGEYFAAIQRESPQFKCGEADFLIGSCADSAMRQFTAQTVFEHYSQSPLMGDEAVAVHVFDAWFGSGRVKMRSEAEFFAAQFFAEFNRQSLIGKRAPEVTMQDRGGEEVTLFGAVASGEGSWSGPEAWASDGAGNSEEDSVAVSAAGARSGGRLAVLYFYDTGCATCRADAIMLKHIFAENPWPIDFYAIYTGADREAWEKYIAEHLDFPLPADALHHLWDPDMRSEYQFKYGVVKTPMIFLIDKDATILGRRLDPVSLTQLLDAVCVTQAEKACEFGSKASQEFFDGIFGAGAASSASSEPTFGAALGASVGEAASGASADSSVLSGMSIAASVETVDAVRNRIVERTLALGDTLLFRQMTGDMMYYLSGKRGESAKTALSNLIEADILGRRELWAKSADSLAILPFAEILHDLLSRTPVGEKLPQIEVPAELHRGKKIKEAKFRLDKQRNTVLIFYTHGCEVCKTELAAVYGRPQSGNTLTARTPAGKAFSKQKFLLIDMDDLLTYRPETAKILFDSFDLTSFPLIIRTDKKARVTGKYLSLRSRTEK